MDGAVPVTDSTVIAGRSFAVGDVVLSCEPWIWCFRWSTYENVCAFCFKERPGLQSCSKCKVHRYCDRKCQTADWKKEHKIECEVMENLGLAHANHNCSLHGCDRSADHTRAILMFKLAKRFQLGVLHEFPGLGKKTVVEILSMLHSNPRPEKADNYIRAAESFASIWTMMRAKSVTPVPSFQDCVKIIWHNQFPIRSRECETQSWGLALFPQALHWNMTPVCWDTNVTMDFIGRRLVIHAVQEIDNFTGLHDLRYNDLLLLPYFLTRVERREAFMEIHGHPCTCRKCTNEYDADINPLKCVTVGCMERLPSDNRALDPCPQCGAINADRLEKLQEFIRKCADIPKACYPDPDRAAVQIFDLLNDIDTAGIAHEDAHIRFVCGWKLATELNTEDEYEKAWKLHQQLLPCVRKIHPTLHIALGNRLMDAAFGPIMGVTKVIHNVMSRPPSVSKADLLSKLYAMYPEVLDLLKEVRIIFVKLGEDPVRINWLLNTIEEVEKVVEKR